MNTRTAVAAIAVLAATLTACSGNDSADSDKPRPTATAAASKPAPDPAQTRQDCVDAVKEAIDADPGTDDLEPPAECASLSDSDYLDAYMDGLQAHNKAGRDALGGSTDQ